MSDDIEHLATGTRVGPYRIVRFLGSGGFGITYQAHDPGLGRQVAIKEFCPDFCARRTHTGEVVPQTGARKKDAFERGVRRFVAEAETLQAISHRNVVQVHEILMARGTGFMVMEYIDGETLEAWIARAGPLDHGAARFLIEHLADGLQAVHDAGFQHRDLKPSNVMMRASDGEPVLIDFGAARKSESAGHTTTRFVSQGYSPIELSLPQLKPGPVSDVYGLAATGWHAVTGRDPPDPMSDRYGAAVDPLEPLATLGGQWAPFLAALDRGLALMPENRPQDLRQWRALFDQPLADTTRPPQRLRQEGGTDGPRLDRRSEPRPMPPAPRGGAPLAALLAAIWVVAWLAGPEVRGAGASMAGALASAGIIAAMAYLAQAHAERLIRAQPRRATRITLLHWLASPVIAMGAVLLLAGLASTLLPGAADAVGPLQEGLRLQPLAVAGAFAVFPLAALLSGQTSLSTTPGRVGGGLGGGIAGALALGWGATIVSPSAEVAMERLGQQGYFVVLPGAPAPVQDLAGDADAVNRAAISRFQATAGLPESGEMDRLTISRLRGLEPVNAWLIDPAAGDGVRELALALDACRPGCRIEIAAGRIDAAAAGTPSGALVLDAGGGARLQGRPGAVLAGGDLMVRDGGQIAGLTLQGLRLTVRGGDIGLSGLGVTAPPGQPGLVLVAGTGGPVTVEDVSVASDGRASALEVTAALDGDAAAVTLSRLEVSVADAAVAAPVLVTGAARVRFAGGRIAYAGTLAPPVNVAEQAQVEIDAMAGACFRAQDSATVTLSGSNLSSCAPPGRFAFSALDSAEVRLGPGNVIPGWPGPNRYRLGGQGRVSGLPTAEGAP